MFCNMTVLFPVLSSMAAAGHLQLLFTCNIASDQGTEFLIFIQF